MTVSPSGLSLSALKSGAAHDLGDGIAHASDEHAVRGPALSVTPRTLGIRYDGNMRASPLGNRTSQDASHPSFESLMGRAVIDMVPVRGFTDGESSTQKA